MGTHPEWLARFRNYAKEGRASVALNRWNFALVSRQKLAVSVVLQRVGRFLLVKRANPPGQGLYAFPGGRVKVGEPLEVAARRELFEETGLHGDDLKEVARYDLPVKDGGFRLHVFSASRFDGELQAADDALSANWYSLDEMRAMPVPLSVFEVAEILWEKSKQ